MRRGEGARDLHAEQPAATDLSRLYQRHRACQHRPADIPDGPSCRRDGGAFHPGRQGVAVRLRRSTARCRRLARAPGAGPRQGYQGRSVLIHRRPVDALPALHHQRLARPHRPLYQLPRHSPLVPHLREPHHPTALPGELRRERHLQQRPLLH